MPPIDRVKLEKVKRERAARNNSVIVKEAPDLFQWIANEVTIEDPHRVTSGTIIKFDLWQEQKDYLNLLHNKKQTITLKARQLGVSWATITYALWLCIFHQNVTVLVFSKDKDAAEEIIRRARGIFKRLANKPVKEEGRENVKSIVFSNSSRFKAFATTKNAGTSFTGTLLIVDEADKMEYGHDLYTSIRPTIADGGRIAIIFTAFGEDGMGRAVWEIAGQEDSTITRFFIPWYIRPGRTQQWYDAEAASAISMAHHRQEYPATPEEALGFTDLDSRLVRDIDQWKVLAVPRLDAPAHLPCVMAIDAGVTSDLFVAVSACWHLTKSLPIIRDVKTWNPTKTESGQLDFKEAQDWIKKYISLNRVRRVVYDPYQMVSFGQELQRIVDAREFSQGTERVQSDTSFRTRILRGEVGHVENDELNEHIFNANIKVLAEEKRVRLIKRNKSLKIDLAVASSMAIWELTNEFAFNISSHVPQSGVSVVPHNPVFGRSKAFTGLPNLLYKRAIKKR